ncbi:2,3-bisphosphoglycerate-dependent phosphoglycerate mutase [Halanaerobium congolense]|jgi:2,3-bisphosphoglycerate-dependent phosphoglycerate mutase|uniref:2,3-bisphosphoglycerate-dependent phosphoglycerate mutase n=2 Tax=Halanaerobium congolense TaxID=54121 RepID=A0A1G6QBK5_9FIRM|nr:2,3-diphosphoglycerate-dependent phosphoglycerate mutase [Halanaerobium congolense]KXS49474.1 MAG: phosphoglycerate mutase [Halanaerobium sp. T82-1]OEG62222.1 MAG: phosphoglyceromutase [Halanaerobium sp. MDAL1]PUU92130.1 MAG: phosphoglycerate mutase [Halanaerobium sp.]PTX17916.1 2,3-bisphosphoglycerate-dependent phosphoglycerate mutase [Halanaerobium congolense]PXV67920.1 2,3-bisphosphoglycerate-dependent phosphoglycerate mutase [Halanaerobium congolense]
MKIVLVRHGESEWNLANKFTGWTDVDLSEQGFKEAEEAGKLLKEEGFTFDLAYTSYLKRATKTLNIILDIMDLHWIPVIKSWKLNERHYGALQGLNKSETAEKEGAEQVHIWRRSFDTPPPALDKADERYPGNEEKYAELTEEELPTGESLKMTIERVMPYWENEIVPQMEKGKKIIVSAHGNSLRALVKHLDNISDEDISSLNIPTGRPLVYEFDEKMNVQNKYYLGDQEEIEKEMNKVKNQAKK